MIGNKFLITDTFLGKGTFGDVYLARDEYNNELAVKCCDIDRTGIPNILEACIMKSLVHPHLSKCYCIQSSENKLYLIQELAVVDLAQHTRRDKNNYSPSIEELKAWCYAITQGLQCLHNHNVIHADIKASNVLLYKNGTVKLSDFTLATYKSHKEEKFRHNACTVTHRPLECFLKQEWDEALDIWSLGCTFYEIAYGELLFAYQGNLENISTEKKKSPEFKARLRKRFINAIVDWGTRGPNPADIDTTTYELNYIKFNFPERVAQEEMASFNNLLWGLLQIDPRKRLTITEILAHPFFTNCKLSSYLVIKVVDRKIGNSEKLRISRYIEKYSDNSSVQKLAMSIYIKSHPVKESMENLRAATCVWIASKIICGCTPDINISIDRLISIEREICNDLKFRLCF